MKDDQHQLLLEAITAVRDGRRGAAHTMLRQVIAEDPSNIDGWLWLSGVEAEPAAQWAALQQVARLDPKHPRAQSGLRWLREHYPELDTLSKSSSPPPTTSRAIFAPSSATPAIHSRVTQPMEAIPASSPSREVQPPISAFADATSALEDQRMFIADTHPRSTDDPAEELRCPFCGTWAGETDRVCPQCDGALFMQVPPKPIVRLSRALLALIWLISTVGALLGSIWVLGDIGRIDYVTTNIGLLLTAFGFAQPQDSMIISIIGLVLGGIAALGVIMVTGFILRWRTIYILQVLLATAALLGSITLLVLVASAIMAGIVPFTGAGTAGSLITVGLLAFVLLPFLLTLGCRREFFPRYGRIRLPIDSAPALELYTRGIYYRDLGWPWAAIRELQTAVDQAPEDIEYRQKLAEAYSAVGHEDRARAELRAVLDVSMGKVPEVPMTKLVKDVSHGRQ